MIRKLLPMTAVVTISTSAVLGCTTVGVTQLSQEISSKSPGCHMRVYFEAVEVEKSYDTVCDINSHVSGFSNPTRSHALQQAVDHGCACGADALILGTWSGATIQSTMKITGIKFKEASPKNVDKNAGKSVAEAHDILTCRDRGGQWVAGTCEGALVRDFENTPNARRLRSHP